MQANEAKIGDTILYANMLWTVLDKDKNGNIKIFAINNTNQICVWGQMTNNWEGCSLRREMYDIFPEIDLSDLVEFERDLRTEEGNDKYGKCIDKISLISADEYRKYCKLIPQIGKQYWTLTGESPEYEYSVYVCYVDDLKNKVKTCYDVFALWVRPLCVLKSSTEIKKFANNRKNG